MLKPKGWGSNDGSSLCSNRNSSLPKSKWEATVYRVLSKRIRGSNGARTIDTNFDKKFIMRGEVPFSQPRLYTFLYGLERWRSKLVCVQTKLNHFWLWSGPKNSKWGGLGKCNLFIRKIVQLYWRKMVGPLPKMANWRANQEFLNGIESSYASIIYI